MYSSLALLQFPFLFSQEARAKEAKSKKERASNTSVTTNESPFVSPEGSPIIESNNVINNEIVKIPIIDNKLNDYKLSNNKKEEKKS